jgi:HAD superfamily hydrolase (TIGR01484 family)
LRPLSAFAEADRRGIRGVLADIDDTLTTAGALTARAYGALERLHDGGLLCIPITGRPAGWCDHIARMWPVDAVVGENGAFYFRHDPENRTLTRRFLLSADERAANRQRLDMLARRILAEVPGVAIASDQPYRVADLAIDYCEDVPRASDDAVDRVLEIFRSEGAQAKLSSIHVNGWFGDYDKLAMTRIMLAECFGIDLDAEKSRLVFIGDSPNDAPMFAAFPHAVGVANIRDFADRIETPPAYVTPGRAGAGFAELADALLTVR